MLDAARLPRSLAACVAAAALLFPLPACGDGAPIEPTITIGLVAKSQSNPVFQAAHTGARAAVEARGGRAGGKRLVLDIQTPPDEDAARQAQAIEQLARAGVAGIAVACSDANTLRPAIDKAVELGAVVMCFDSDAPASERLCYFGTDDIACGQEVMRELAAAMGETGTIAILAGNQSAPNLQKRVQGVRDELARHTGMRLLDDGVIYHPETPEQAFEAVRVTQAAHPEIDGWAFVGGWPLFARAPLPWEPGAVKVVSVDALPEQLPHLQSGHVEVLLAQDCYGWGQAAVDILLAKIVDGADPDGERILAPLTRVTADDVDAWQAKWEGWLSSER